MKKGLRVFSAAVLAAIATCGLAACNNEDQPASNSVPESTQPSASTTPEVQDTLTGISVSTTSAKTEFKVGEAFTSQGISVNATWSVSGKKAVSAGDYQVDYSKVDSTKTGNYIVTVSYQGKSTTYEVTYSAVESTVESVTVVSTGAKVNYEIGETISYEGLKVVAKTVSGKNNVVTDFGTALTDSKGNTVTGAFTVTGTYTVTVTVEDKTATYNVTVIPAQYKQTVTFSAADIKPLSEGESYNVGYKYVDTELLQIVQAGYTGGTEDGTINQIDGVEYNKALQIKCATNSTVTSSYHITLKSKLNAKIVIYGYAKKSGQSLVLADTTDTKVDNQEGKGTVDAAAGLQKTEFTLTADHTYKLYNASTGGNYCVYKIDFVYSLEQSSVKENQSMEISGQTDEFALAGDDKFDFAAPKGLVVKSYNNYGFADVLDSSKYTVTVTAKNSTEAISEISAAGEYTVTVAINGTELKKTYDITVIDTEAAITDVKVNEGTTAKTVYYQDEDLTLSLGNSIVTFTQGNERTAKASEYTLSLVNASKEAVETFSTAGVYYIKVTSNAATTVATYVEVHYETATVAIDTTNAKTTISKGATVYANGITATKTWTNTANAAKANTKDLTDDVKIAFYSDAACTGTEIADAATAFANLGTVYAKATLNGADAKIVTISVVDEVAINIELDATTLTTANSEAGDTAEAKNTPTSEDLLGFFETVGTVQLRSKKVDGKFTSTCSAIEAQKDGGLKFTVDSEVKVTVIIASTGGSNESIFKMVGANGVINAETTPEGATVANGMITVIGTAGQTVEYTLASGTYEMIFDGSTGRGGRFLKITVSNQ